jgi:hypothetical protein
MAEQIGAADNMLPRHAIGWLVRAPSLRGARMSSDYRTSHIVALTEFC